MRSPITLQTKAFPIEKETVEFSKDVSKFVSINSSKGVMKIFIDINDKKVQNENKSESNFHLLFFKDIQIKDEFQEFTFKVVNNIEVKLNLKLKNKFNSSTNVGNLFQKFQQTQNKKEEANVPKSIIGTGVNMKERLAMFSNTNKENPIRTSNSNSFLPKKLKNRGNLIDSKFKDNKEIQKENKNKEEVNKEDKKIKENDNIDNKQEEIKQEEKKQNNEIKQDDEKKENKEETKEENTVKDKKEENVEETKEENTVNEKKEETKEENKEETKDENKEEPFYSDVDEQNDKVEVSSGNINEKEKIDKRPSQIFNYSNPLKFEEEKEEAPRPSENPIIRDQNQDKKKDIQKSVKILEKSNMLKNLFQKKSSENEGKNLTNKNVDFSKRNISVNIELNKKTKKKIEENIGLSQSPSNTLSEKDELNDDMSLRSASTEFSSCKSIIPEIILDSITYDKYIEQLKQKGKTENDTKRETFCEGFFIASFPYKNGQIIENSNDIFPALCGHPECSKLNAMKPEIIIRYPLEDTKDLELNNLAATICFPTGIKVCYSQDEEPKGINDYITNITNQKGERYYMMTYHFYRKMMNDDYAKKYEMHPLKHHLMKFGDAYLTFREEEFTEDIIEKVQTTLEFCQDLGFREYVYIPYCLCLISKYPYSFEMEKCLQSIFKVMTDEKSEYNFEINDLIMYLINSIPIPDKNSLIKFYLPYVDKDISLRNTTINGLNIVNIDFSKLTHIFSISNIIIIFRLLLSEKKILFIDDDYTTLSKVTDAFISLLYPLKWVHTYIPIMSEQMLKYLESFLPFVNGIHTSLMPLVKNIFNEGEIDENEEVFLVYIKENEIQIGSYLKKKKIKMSKYIQNNVLPLPTNIEKELKKKLVDVQNNYEFYLKNIKKKNNIDITQLDFKFREAFIDVFVNLFHDYQKFIGLLDEDEVIFNKNLFMQNIKKDERPFYDSLLDTQLFEQFTQNILNTDCNYFNKKVEIFLKKLKNKDARTTSSTHFILDKNYIVKPDFLKLEDDFYNIVIEKTLTEKFKIDSKTNENGIILPSERIITNINNISNDKYDKSKIFIYLLPEKKETNQKNKEEIEIEKEDFRAEILKKLNTKRVFPMPMITERERHRRQTHLKITTREVDLTEKRKEIVKDEIKEWVIRIFKSEVEDYKDNPKIKTDVLSLINNPFGIKCFVDLISHNNQSVIMLQKNSIRLLGLIIYNALLFLLNYEENDEVLEECVLLFKSLNKFEVKVGDKNKSLLDISTFKANLMKYVRINQKNFWIKWFNIELKENLKNKKKENDEDDVDNDEIENDKILKQQTLFNVCMKMIDLEIPKTTIKNICDDINDKIFGKATDFGKQTSDKYINNITSANYSTKTI